MTLTVSKDLYRQWRQNLRNHLCHATLDELHAELAVTNDRVRSGTGSEERAKWIQELIDEQTQDDLPLPRIHFNGSGKDNLVRQLTDSSGDQRRALDTIRLSYPHGRDYYTAADGTLTRAVEAHWERLTRLEKLIDDFDQLALAISNL